MKRVRAEKIEGPLENHLASILQSAGYFEKIEGQIRKVLADTPTALKTEKMGLTKQSQKLSLAIRNTFKIQAALDPKSDAIREVAVELQNLSQRKREVEDKLAQLQEREFCQGDVDDSVEGLRDRLQTFTKGWAKAPAIVKKALLKDLIQSVIVGPKGLQIIYLLKTESGQMVTPLNVGSDHTAPKNVIEINSKRIKPPSGASATSRSNNSSVVSSEVVKSGSGGGT